MCEGFLSQDNAIWKWGMETSISGRTEPDYEQLTMQKQIKKIIDAQPKYLSLRLDHAFSFFFVQLRKGPANASW